MWPQQSDIHTSFGSNMLAAANGLWSFLWTNQIHRDMYQSTMALKDAKYTNRFQFTAKIKHISTAHVLSESMPFIVVKMQSAFVTKTSEIQNSVTRAHLSKPLHSYLSSHTNDDFA